MHCFRNEIAYYRNEYAIDVTNRHIPLQFCTYIYKFKYHCHIIQYVRNECANEHNGYGGCLTNRHNL